MIRGEGITLQHTTLTVRNVGLKNKISLDRMREKIIQAIRTKSYTERQSATIGPLNKQQPGQTKPAVISVVALQKVTVK